MFTASVIGNSLSGGAHAYQYADSNGSLGLMNDGTLDEPSQSGNLFTKFPAYWGIGMWTGLNGTLRRYGDHLVEANSAVAALEVYATDNGKILAINKDTADHHVTIGLGGSVAGTYAVWQTNAERPLAASPLTVDYSRQVYLDNMALPWVLGSLLLALDVQRRQWHYIAAGACFAVAVLSKETTLLLFPVVLDVIYQRTAAQLRTMALVSAASAGLLLMGIYLFAALRNELVPGRGHVSLWTQGIAYQLFNRQGSGAVWQTGSPRSALLSGWLGHDRVLIVGGLAAACILVFVRNLRPIALAIAIGALIVLKPGGWLPSMYVIVSLPFLALAIVACAERRSTAGVRPACTCPGA